jgi:hypothetical protein
MGVTVRGERYIPPKVTPPLDRENDGTTAIQTLSLSARRPARD